MQLALACQRSMIFAQRKLRLSMQNTYMVTVEILVTDVLTIPLHSAHSFFLIAITLPPVGFTITLMHLRVLMAVTISLKFWNEYQAFDRMLRLFSTIGVSIVFTIGFVVFVVHLTCLSGRFVFSCLQTQWSASQCSSRSMCTWFLLLVGMTTSWRSGPWEMPHLFGAKLEGPRIVRN